MDDPMSRKSARPSSSADRADPISRLVAERGATLPSADLLELVRRSKTPPASGPSSLEVLEEMRAERL
jgi:hypothetical protein